MAEPSVNKLPEGFVLDKADTTQLPSGFKLDGLPEGFVLDKGKKELPDQKEQGLVPFGLESLQRGLFRVLPQQIGQAVDFMTDLGMALGPFQVLYTDEMKQRQKESLKQLREKGFGGKAFEQLGNLVNVEEAPEEYQQPIKSLSELKDPKRAIQVIGEQGPAMLGNIAAVIANPTYGAVLMFGIEGGETYAGLNELEKQTGKPISQFEKLALSSTVGAVNAALEKLGIDVVLGRIPGLKSRLAQLALSPITEATTESLQEINQVIAEKTGKRDFELTIEDLQRIQTAAYGGAVLGIAGGGSSQAIQYGVEAIDKRIGEKTIDTTPAIEAEPEQAEPAPELKLEEFPDQPQAEAEEVPSFIEKVKAGEATGEEIKQAAKTTPEETEAELRKEFEAAKTPEEKVNIAQGIDIVTQEAGKKPKFPNELNSKQLANKMDEWAGPESYSREGVQTGRLAESQTLLNKHPNEEFVRTEIDPNIIKRQPEAIDKNVVSELKSKGSENLPPPVVEVNNKGEIVKIDGAHRIELARQEGKNIEVYAPKKDISKITQEAGKKPQVPEPPAEQEAEEAPTLTATEKQETALTPEFVTGIKHRVVTEEREQRGLEELQVAGRREWGKVWDEATEKIRSKEIVPRELSKELSENPRPITDTEAAVLDYERVSLNNIHRKVSDAIGNAKTEEEAVELKRTLLDVEDALNTNDIAAKQTGTETARGLAFRRAMVKSDYSLASVVQQARNANKGKKISDETRGKLEKLTTALEDAQKKLKEYEESGARAEGQEAVETIKREVRKKKRQAKKEDLDAEYEDLIKQFAKTENNLNALVNPQQVALLAKMAVNRVQSGVTTIEQLVDDLYAVAKDHVKGLTKRDVRDAISGYGKYTPLTKDEIKLKLRDIREQGRLISAIEDIEAGKKPLKSGFERKKQSVEAKKLQKKLNLLRKKLSDAEKKPGSDTNPRLKAYKTRLKKEIERLEKGEPRKPQKSLKLDAEAEKLKQRLNELRKKLSEAEKKPKSDTDPRLKAYKTRLKREIERIEKGLPKKPRKSLKLDAEAEKLKEKLNQLRNKAGYDTESKLNAYKTRLKNEEAKLKQMIKEGDFKKPEPRKKLELDPEAEQLKRNVYRLKRRVNNEIAIIERKNRPLRQKIYEGIVDIANIPRSFISSLDLSATLRQGGFLFPGHFREHARAFKQQFKYMRSEEFIDKLTIEIEESPNSILYDKSGLYLANKEGNKLQMSHREERFLSTYAEKTPVVGRFIKGSERAYTGFLDKLRMDVFDDMANQYLKAGMTFEKNPEVFKALADYINAATGRGDLGKTLNKVAPLLNGVFFSPRLIASRLKLLNPVYYARLPKQVRIQAMKDAIKFVGAGMSVLALAGLAGADIEDDPRSSDFGKIKIGNMRLDIWGGFQQFVVLFARLISGQQKSIASGEVRDLDGKKFPFTTRKDLLIRFAEQKLSPTAAFARDLLSNQGFMGEDLSIEQQAINLTVPLYMRDFYEATRGMGYEGALLAAPGFFGVGTQYYEPKKKKTRRTVSK